MNKKIAVKNALVGSKVCAPRVANAQLALIFLISATLGFTSCSTPTYRTTTGHNVDYRSVLTQQQAADRFDQVTQISYELQFALGDLLDQFDAHAIVRFDLKPKASGTLKLDLEGGTVMALNINGMEIPKPQKADSITDEDIFDGHHIFLKVSKLKPTGNEIKIHYSHPYSQDGNGLHRFKDPADGRVYLYSNFEPYNAHRVFPCFDQPDLKATFEVTAEVPKEWTVISSALHSKIVPSEGKRTFHFEKTALFSPYLFSIHAGPYSIWKSKAGNIPMRLFARKSLAKYVRSSEWFETTKKGLEFFSVQFGYPYPFKKYDQIIVPDFNSGAMENVASVTFSERFIDRTTRVTEDRKRARANTILHEMAHMWFGDLVTLKWWNGLWLNESFATYMAAWAGEHITDYKGNWGAFAHMKSWAYWEDQLATTHPVEQPVDNTLEAQASFDGITYGKGASALKQLKFYLGEDDFREGIQRYFQRFAYSNTTIQDFFKTLSEASNKFLRPWQKVWLQTPGLNSVKAQWQCDIDPTGQYEEEITKFELIQTGSPLRPHKTQIGLYVLPPTKSKSARLIQTRTLNATYEQDVTAVGDIAGLRCPDFAFPNYNDEDYVKITLDAKDLKFVSEHFGAITQPLMRQTLWNTLWEMVVDGKLKASAYIDLVMTHAANEQDTLVLDKILSQISQPLTNNASAIKYVPEQDRSKLNQKIESFVLSELKKAKHSSDVQLIWYNAALRTTQSKAGIDWLKKLLMKTTRLRGLDIDQERRWELVQTIARSGDSDAEVLINAELDRDQTDSGQKQALAATVEIPDARVKDLWLDKIYRRSDRPESTSRLKTAMQHYHVLENKPFTKAMVESYYKRVEAFHSSPVEDDQYALTFTRHMFPSLCEQEIVYRTQDFIEENKDLKAPLLKSLHIALQNEQRCIKARKMQELKAQ